MEINKEDFLDGRPSLIFTEISNVFLKLGQVLEQQEGIEMETNAIEQITPD